MKIKSRSYHASLIGINTKSLPLPIGSCITQLNSSRGPCLSSSFWLSHKHSFLGVAFHGHVISLGLPPHHAYLSNLGHLLSCSIMLLPQFIPFSAPITAQSQLGRLLTYLFTAYLSTLQCKLPEDRSMSFLLATIVLVPGVEEALNHIFPSDLLVANF